MSREVHGLGNNDRCTGAVNSITGIIAKRFVGQALCDETIKEIAVIGKGAFLIGEIDDGLCLGTFETELLTTLTLHQKLHGVIVREAENGNRDTTCQIIIVCSALCTAIWSAVAMVTERVEQFGIFRFILALELEHKQLRSITAIQWTTFLSFERIAD